MPEQKRRRVKPLRVILIIIIFAAFVYVGLCVLQFGYETILPLIKKDDIEAESVLPELTEFSGSTSEYMIGILSQDEKFTVDQSMMLINKEHPLKSDFEPQVSEYKETGVWFNDCMHNGFSELSAEVKDRFEEKLFVSSAYRTAEEQQREIEEEGSDIAQAVGASEHQAGLCADVYILYYAGENFTKTEAGKWVDSDCWRYGFIVRYPKYGKSSTGIGFEPWHIRYVGAPHAEYIMRNSTTLEDYYAELSDGILYKITCSTGEYAVIRSTSDGIIGPKEYKRGIISDDNAGGKIVTFVISENDAE